MVGANLLCWHGHLENNLSYNDFYLNTTWKWCISFSVLLFVLLSHVISSLQYWLLFLISCSPFSNNFKKKEDVSHLDTLHFAQLNRKILQLVLLWGEQKRFTPSSRRHKPLEFASGPVLHNRSTKKDLCCWLLHHSQHPYIVSRMSNLNTNQKRNEQYNLFVLWVFFGFFWEGGQ